MVMVMVGYRYLCGFTDIVTARVVRMIIVLWLWASLCLLLWLSLRLSLLLSLCCFNGYVDRDRDGYVTVTVMDKVLIMDMVIIMVMAMAVVICRRDSDACARYSGDFATHDGF